MIISTWETRLNGGSGGGAGYGGKGGRSGGNASSTAYGGPGIVIISW